jgi:hypothetical protein
MPRYILVEFDDNAQAKKFVERVNGHYGLPLSERPFRVRAVWARATKYCMCTRSSGKMWSFSRGMKSGWWLHSDCGRPTRAWATGTHWFASIGRNILPGNIDYVPEGWGVPNAIGDPKTNDVAHIVPIMHEPSERLFKKAERRRNRKRKAPNPRRV